MSKDGFSLRVHGFGDNLPNYHRLSPFSKMSVLSIKLYTCINLPYSVSCYLKFYSWYDFGLFTSFSRINEKETLTINKFVLF